MQVGCRSVKAKCFEEGAKKFGLLYFHSFPLIKALLFCFDEEFMSRIFYENSQIYIFAESAGCQLKISINFVSLQERWQLSKLLLANASCTDIVQGFVVFILENV